MFKKGQIWVVQFSFTNSDSIGHEQADKRPCIIIKNNEFAKMTTIIPLTTQTKTLRFPYTYLIKKTKVNNLKFDSVAFVFQIRSLSYKRFHTQIGIIDKSDLNHIETLINEYFFA